MMPKPQLTIYSRRGCAPCQTLKNFLDQRKVNYQSVDLDSTPSAIQTVLELSGLLIVPTIKIETEGRCEVISGCNLSRVAKLVSY